MAPKTRAMTKHDAFYDSDGDDEYYDSDEESVNDQEDYVVIFAGLTKGQILGNQRMNWKQHKDAIVKHALVNGYSSSNMPTIEDILELIQVIGLPLFAGSAVASICVGKLIDTIENTVSPTGLPGLLLKTTGGVKVSTALLKFAQRDNFSFDKVKCEKMQAAHAMQSPQFHMAPATGSSLSKKQLKTAVISRLVVRGQITNENVVKHLSAASRHTGHIATEKSLNYLGCPSPIKGHSPNKGHVAKEYVMKHSPYTGYIAKDPVVQRSPYTGRTAKDKVVKHNTAPITSSLTSHLVKDGLCETMRRLPTSDRQELQRLSASLHAAGVDREGIERCLEKKLRSFMANGARDDLSEAGLGAENPHIHGNRELDLDSDCQKGIESAGEESAGEESDGEEADGEEADAAIMLPLSGDPESDTQSDDCEPDSEATFDLAELSKEQLVAMLGNWMKQTSAGVKSARNNAKKSKYRRIPLTFRTCHANKFSRGAEARWKAGPE